MPVDFSLKYLACVLSKDILRHNDLYLKCENTDMKKDKSMKNSRG